MGMSMRGAPQTPQCNNVARLLTATAICGERAWGDYLGRNLNHRAATSARADGFALGFARVPAAPRANPLRNRWVWIDLSENLNESYRAFMSLQLQRSRRVLAARDGHF